MYGVFVVLLVQCLLSLNKKHTPSVRILTGAKNNFWKWTFSSASSFYSSTRQLLSNIKSFILKALMNITYEHTKACLHYFVIKCT